MGSISLDKSGTEIGDMAAQLSETTSFREVENVLSDVFLRVEENTPAEPDLL